MYLDERQKVDDFQNRGRERDVFVAVMVKPNPRTVPSFDRYTDASDWCVSLAVAPPLPNGSATELAAVDTTHGTPHIDRYWTSTDGPQGTDKIDKPNWDLTDGETYIFRNHQHILQNYIANHGPP